MKNKGKLMNENLIEIKNIADLKKAEYNPRKLTSKQRLDLLDSLKKYGFVEPVVINKDNTIIGGHQRVACWKELGNVVVPCLVLDLKKEDEKELNIRLNKNTGDWDWELLEENFSIDSLVDWGFDEWDFKSETAELPEQKAEVNKEEKEEKICEACGQTIK